MDYERAKEVVIAEGIGSAGIVGLARVGEEPSEERIRNLLTALRVVYEGTRADGRIEKPLAHALFCLGAHLPTQLESWARNRATISPALKTHHLSKVSAGAESILQGEWIEIE